ncbi:serine/threonine-protein kinase [Anabaena sp. UHCC 0204]|uniref:serine/threonine-protein kinase n=1 Tax=Anabaena sp. UHCC 0204 TaxID=2590009 RepID=UPI001447A97C|nr:serine/threonine-protein kinase [Anabaena sp. UHCC 0204]MTJ10276.1 protein kinase [Anabaena sp. UHCC 0204]
MNQICCLNPDCHNPPVLDTTKFCPNCGVSLVILRNRYRPVKPLGGGGFGKTYLAEDVDKLNEKCVIKQFAPQTQNTYALKKAKELFEQEAIQLKDLKHPQIPQLQAYFDEDDCLYLIQDFIEGENLLIELANQGTFNEQKIRDLLLDLLPVLQIVHSNNIIHRDIKPENIMRRRSDGKLFLIDFGASKQLQGTMRPGTKIGTFGYAAIEQMEDREVYPASDLFSLGATCFHLMTGVYPGDLWNRQGYSWVKDWRKHLQQSVSLELGQILDKLLKLENQDRYQSVEEVLQALKAPPKTNYSRRGFLQIAGLVVGGFTIAVILPTIFGNKNRKLTKPLVILKNITSAILVNTLTGHFDGVNSLAISPDGKILVSGSGDKKIKIWNLPTGKLKSTLTGHKTSISYLAVTPDARTLVSASWDDTIKIWNLQTGKLKSTLTGHSNGVYSLAISPDGKILVSGSGDKKIKIWNLQTGKLKSTLTGHSNWVSSLAISPDGKILVSGSYDKTIKIWNLLTGKLKSTLTGHSNWVHSLAISPDGKTLVTGSADNTIKIWNLQTGKLKFTLTGHSGWVRFVTISPDGKTLVSGSWDDTIKIWNLQTGKLKSTLTDHSNDVNALAISPDGKTLVSGSNDNTIKIWRLE